MVGDLEKSHEFYSIAKISGIKLCEAYKKQYGSDFFSVNPSNIYGIEDKIDPLNSHVMSSLIHRIWTAKKENIDFRLIEGLDFGTSTRASPINSGQIR